MIALFAAFKSFMALAAASGLFFLLHDSSHNLALKFVEHLHLNPASHFPNVFIAPVGDLQNIRFSLVAIGAATYSMIRFFEAYGLLHEAAWAQLLAVASGVIYLPFEVFELVQGASVLGVLVLLANLLIVFGMAYSLVYRKAKIAK